MEPPKNLTCLNCGKPAEWIRYTQFSGNHPYCAECAKKEEDFQEGDASYSSWDKYTNPETAEQRLLRIRKEIFDIRQEADKKIAALQKEAEGLFESSPDLKDIPEGQLFYYDLHGPLCKKGKGSDAYIEEDVQSKGMLFRMSPFVKVFLVG